MKRFIALSILTLALGVLMSISHDTRAQQNGYQASAPWTAQDHATQTRRITSRLNSAENTHSEQTRKKQNQYRDKNASSQNTFGAPVYASGGEIIHGNILQSPPSPIEEMYARRIIDDVHQFGYDLFGVPKAETQEKLNTATSNSPHAMPAGAVQDDFILNMGDEVEVTFSGQRSERETYKINNNGQLLIKDFPPIPAAGRSIGQVRISLEAAARNLHNTETYISLSSVRQISILVVGHVKRPGRKNLTVFHTVLDALMEAGGVQKSGSLRQIKLVRHGRSTLIDLYGLLMHGASTMDLQLRDGDRIIIPPLGPTIAISGEVKRPGIYEILSDFKGMHHKSEDRSQKISLNDALDFAGGVLVPGSNRFMKLDIKNNGSEKVSEVDDAFRTLFSDGDILMVSRGEEKRADTVELTGHTRTPGIFALDNKDTLSKLLPDEKALGADIYPLIGVIERWDPKQLTNIYHSFPLRLVISGDYDRKLHDGDVVHLFSKAQIATLAEDFPTTPSDKYKNQYASNTREDFNQGFQNGFDTRTEQGSIFEAPEEAFLQDNPVLASFLKERSVFIRGAIRSAGPYPVAEGVTLDNVIAVAGGLTLEANTSNIEVTSTLHGQNGQALGRSGTHRKNVDLNETSAQNITIAPGDSIRINQKFRKVEDESVLLIGEVRNPGRYDLMPGDKISDLIKRAGGLTQQAYPDGAVFSREQERRAEESRFRAAARDLERALAAAIERNDDKAPTETEIAMARSLATELRDAEALGRITIEADPGALSTNPELDMLLESGDRLYIPKRPLTVRVSGEILSPASLQFRDRKKPLDYVEEAGGFTFHADRERTFVLYPDGSAQPLQVSTWNYKPVFIPPGSTIIVPRDPKPFDFIQSAKDISQILSNLAITGIFIEDIRN